MKKIIFVITLVFFSSVAAFAQLENPVSWSYGAKKISKTEAVVFMKATIDKGWHIYSQHIKPGGPTKTIFTFAPSKDFALIGKTSEPKPITKFEKVFNMNVLYFENQVIFQQKVKLNKGTAIVKGTVEFMVCDERQCLPPEEVSFSIAVK